MWIVSEGKIYIMLGSISIFSVQWVVFLGVISKKCCDRKRISPVLTPPKRVRLKGERETNEFQSSHQLNQFSFVVKSFGIDRA